MISPRAKRRQFERSHTGASHPASPTFAVIRRAILTP
jgi:hypothetical protein